MEISVGIIERRWRMPLRKDFLFLIKPVYRNGLSDGMWRLPTLLP
jgi:hypothetical protein